ncbi:MAG: FMN-binding protein [Desulfobacterales bacterium]|nr:FMN-binding protein [Desulfobacterales bacterium]MDX2511462.1 FMN-binding protein [Desulfobacterales bacterium]
MGTTVANRSIFSRDGFQKSFLAQAWLVLVLAISFGSALAFVQVSLSEVIAANKLNETLTQVPELVWGEDAAQYVADTSIPLEIIPGTVSLKKGQKTTYYRLYQVTRGDLMTGWVVKARGQGYADKIEVLIGVDPDVETITGLFILEQKETPGLGNKITFPVWRKQFVGKKTVTPFVVVKEKSTIPNTIDAVTGATISSRSVAGIVNQTMTDIKGRLNSQAVQTGESQ